MHDFKASGYGVETWHEGVVCGGMAWGPGMGTRDGGRELGYGMGIRYGHAALDEAIMD